jgi:hypothetical protein
VPLGSAGRLARRPVRRRGIHRGDIGGSLLSVFVVHWVSSDMFIDDGTYHPVTSQ